MLSEFKVPLPPALPSSLFSSTCPEGKRGLSAPTAFLIPSWPASPDPVVVPTLPWLPCPLLTVTPPFLQNLDITKKKLVHEGPLTWRVTKDKAVGEHQGGELGPRGWGGGGCPVGVLSTGFAPPAEVHVLLLDDLLLLLQRQDDRLLLKSHSRTLTPTPDGKTMLRPVLRLTSAMTREVATGEARGGEGAAQQPKAEAMRGRPWAGHGRDSRPGCRFY